MKSGYLLSVMKFYAIRKLLALLALSVGVPALAAAQDGNDGEAADYFRERPDSAKYFLTIAGAAASEEIRQRHTQWAAKLQEVLETDYDYDSDRHRLLFDDGTIGDSAVAVDGSSRREDIEAQMMALQQLMNPGDQLTILLLGHGSSISGDAKFNIVGPDITGPEFSALLADFNQHNLVIVDTTSASFEFAQQLSARGRVVISATRSRAERFDPVFAGFFIDALKARNGDRDKNGRVSMLEAFAYANIGVTDWYEEQGRLATEHAVLDDSGDGLFSLEPSPSVADGSLAEIAYVDVPSAADQKQSPGAQQLLVEIQNLERSIFILRGQKADYLEEDYWQQLESLLIELARKTGTYDELP